MSNFDIDAVMKTEDRRIEEILSVSQSLDSNIDEKGSVCPKCRRERSSQSNSFDQDLRRWKVFDSTERNSYFKDQSSCNCYSGLDARRKHDSSKAKRKGQVDVSKGDVNSGKDFIAHNIRTCNSIRFRDSYVSQNCSSFVHYKRPSDYIIQYRLCKIDKLERSAFQVDQIGFSEEMIRGLSNSSSNLTGKISMDEKPSKGVIDDSLYGGKDGKLKDSNQKHAQKLHYFSDFEVSQQQRKQVAKEAETCMRCGDKLKKHDLLKSMSNGLKLEQKLPLRMPHEKFDEKKVQKLIKRSSDHRQRLIVEKPSSVVHRTDVEPAFANELQPFCQQMPIKTSMFVDKRQNVRKDDWRGYPISSKPRFSNGLAGLSEVARNSQTATVRKSSMENLDIFNCYGDKHRLLEESR